MATFVIMVIRLQVIFMFFKCADCQVLSTCLLPIENQECDLNCTTADQSAVISFYKLPDGTNPIGQCLATYCLISNSSLTSKYSIHTIDSTTTTFRINKLSWDEKGTWRCYYGLTPDTTDLGFAKFPDDIEYSGLSNNSDIDSGTVMPITMKCLYTEIPTLVTLIYLSSGGTARSTPFTCTDTTSSCANNNFVSKLCRPIIQVGAGVVCDGNYSIELVTSVLDNEERKYSVLTGITIKCARQNKRLFSKTEDYFIVIKAVLEALEVAFRVVVIFYKCCKGEVVCGLHLCMVIGITVSQILSIIASGLQLSSESSCTFPTPVMLAGANFISPFIGPVLYLIVKKCCDLENRSSDALDDYVIMPFGWFFWIIDVIITQFAKHTKMVRTSNDSPAMSEVHTWSCINKMVQISENSPAMSEVHAISCFRSAMVYDVRILVVEGVYQPSGTLAVMSTWLCLSEEHTMFALFLFLASFVSLSLFAGWWFFVGKNDPRLKKIKIFYGTLIVCVIPIAWLVLFYLLCSSRGEQQNGYKFERELNDEQQESTTVHGFDDQITNNTVEQNQPTQPPAENDKKYILQSELTGLEDDHIQLQETSPTK